MPKPGYRLKLTSLDGVSEVILYTDGAERTIELRDAYLMDEEWSGVMEPQIKLSGGDWQSMSIMAGEFPDE